MVIRFSQRCDRRYPELFRIIELKGKEGAVSEAVEEATVARKTFKIQCPSMSTKTVTVLQGIIYLFSADYALEFAGRLRKLKEEGGLEIVICSRTGVLRFLLYSLVDTCLQSMIFIVIVLITSGLLDHSLLALVTPASILSSTIILLLASMSWFGFGLLLDAPFFVWEHKGRLTTILLLLTGVFGEIYFPLEDLSPRLEIVGDFIPLIMFLRYFRQAFFNDMARSSRYIFLIAISGFLTISILIIGFLAILKAIKLASKKGKTGRSVF